MAENEFEKAYYEAESFWSGNMVNDLANAKRIQLTAGLIEPDVSTLIDVGCGNGVFLKYLQQTKKVSRLVGVERSETALKYVNTEKIAASIEDIPVSSQSFDCVTCLEVLEHLPVTIYEKSLDELARISSKYIIVSVPYKEVLEDSYTRCPSCRTMFNYELHLRSYDDNAINSLLLSRGFECSMTLTTGTGVHYKGHQAYLKTFYPETFYVWRSPVCPICGYSENNNQVQTSPAEDDAAKHNQPKKKLISYISFLPKLFWPKEKKDYWIIALYKRKGE